MVTEEIKVGLGPWGPGRATAGWPPVHHVSPRRGEGARALTGRNPGGCACRVLRKPPSTRPHCPPLQRGRRRGSTGLRLSPHQGLRGPSPRALRCSPAQSTGENAPARGRPGTCRPTGRKVAAGRSRGWRCLRTRRRPLSRRTGLWSCLTASDPYRALELLAGLPPKRGRAAHRPARVRHRAPRSLSPSQAPSAPPQTRSRSLSLPHPHLPEAPRAAGADDGGIPRPAEARQPQGGKGRRGPEPPPS